MFDKADGGTSGTGAKSERLQKTQHRKPAAHRKGTIETSLGRRDAMGKIRNSEGKCWQYGKTRCDVLF